ncbi:FdhF/YdeP family oxidoreductase [Candidatus Ishikawella capsulata]|uniref:FdhF/YdeP family oxidoreductase n=1 Tax=Candidatus Ishikawella capsulata TaxID=168169 RepID=UPI000596BAA9|nr:FdhF/YdeP family oxidoreductase [Candidatus Ishikawaella capsulata]
MKNSNKNVGISSYHNPAGGLDALTAAAKAMHDQKIIIRDIISLFKINQPKGFDCPGCAWPDSHPTSSFEFCENGIKAVSWEATSKRATPEFFAKNTIKELWQWSSFRLENEGRLTHPMKYDIVTDTYKKITWEKAIFEIASKLNQYSNPDSVEFYASGRTSNEAAFLWQLFAREYGTNNFPDCSNMCHEPTSVGLPPSIGVGKGTITLEDFNHCDLVICIGHNPGTNHPRMLGTLRQVSKRGAIILAINPLKERGLESFASPKHPIEMLSLNYTLLASKYYKIRIGGDAALLKGIMKCLISMHDQSVNTGKANVINEKFINQHTKGFKELKTDLEKTSWKTLEDISGLKYKDIEEITHIYAASKRTIICYGMGITQHRNGTYNIQQIVNLLLLGGNIGKKGAGICPLRGHSNVQGNRTVGITEKPSKEFLKKLETIFKFKPPYKHGHGVVDAIKSMITGQSKALLCLGGNLAEAMSDQLLTFQAIRKLDLVVHIATKLNRSHLVLGKDNYLLPVLGRTEIDIQASGEQKITVEDSMSMVHSSQGVLKQASTWLKSEPAVIASLAKTTLLNTKINWDQMVNNYNVIRNFIEAVFPAFKDFNTRIQTAGGFCLYNSAANRIWLTPSGKANFIVMPNANLEELSILTKDNLLLTTIRSHDQYNTTIYGLNDRYRGISGRRDILFISWEEAKKQGVYAGDKVNIIALDSKGARTVRRMDNLIIVIYNMIAGCVATYYPEANIMISLEDYDKVSKTPAYKSIPIVMEKCK